MGRLSIWAAVGVSPEVREGRLARISARREVCHCGLMARR
jgi:hypothetical protein